MMSFGSDPGSLITTYIVYRFEQLEMSSFHGKTLGW